MAASRPIRNPPLQRDCNPFERSAIVAYNPSPIFRIEAKPLSAMGCFAMRGSSAGDSASAGSGANLVAAYNAPRDDVPARKVRRENGFERSLMEPPTRDDATVSGHQSPQTRSIVDSRPQGNGLLALVVGHFEIRFL